MTISRAYRRKVILHRHKKPVAAVVPIEDLEILEQIEDRADMDEVRKRLKEPEGVGFVLPYTLVQVVGHTDIES